jgi:hypothetical protein
MLAGFGPAPPLQAGEGWHSPPELLQLAVVIDAVPEAYVLIGSGGGVAGAGVICVKLTGALASKSARATTVIDKNVPGLR